MDAAIIRYARGAELFENKSWPSLRWNKYLRTRRPDCCRIRGLVRPVDQSGSRQPRGRKTNVEQKRGHASVSVGVHGCVAAIPAASQSFRVQCPTSTKTHPNAANNNSEPAYVGPTYTGTSGYPATPAHVNGAIKCQQISGGDGYATMGDGTQTYMFSFGPLSGLADMAAGQPGTSSRLLSTCRIRGREASFISFPAILPRRTMPTPVHSVGMGRWG